MSVMDWSSVDPVAVIDGRIDVLQQDRDAWQHQRESAHDAKTRALGAADTASAAEDDAARHVREDDEEIEQLREERLRYVPEQRAP